eukprot:gene9966-biopygen10784
MGPEVSPAFQRRSRGPEFGILNVQLAGTGSRQETWECWPSRRDPNRRTRALRARKMIRMASGSSLAFQRLSRDTPNCILSVQLAEPTFSRDAPQIL